MSTGARPATAKCQITGDAETAARRQLGSWCALIELSVGSCPCKNLISRYIVRRVDRKTRHKQCVYTLTVLRKVPRILLWTLTGRQCTEYLKDVGVSTSASDWFRKRGFVPSLP